MPLSKLHLAFGDAEREMATTRRMLERLPNDSWDWQPHVKSFTLGQLACHLVDLLWWQVVTLEQPGIDTAKPWPRTSSGNRDDLLAAFDAHVETLRATFAQTREATLEEPWTLSFGEHEVFTQPKGDVLRVFGLSHVAHHRGQLSVYLRMLDVPLPPSYGPSADEQF